MKENLIAAKSIIISAPAAKVWRALVTPEMIKKYLFGTNAISDWKVGSSIRFVGEWEGKKYEDKGKILASEPEKLLRYTYWSSMRGKPDVPENYATVSYELAGEGGKTKLTIIQDGNDNEESRNHSEQNWGVVLENLKKVVENEV